MQEVCFFVFLMKNPRNIVLLQPDKGNEYEYCRIKWPF